MARKRTGKNMTEVHRRDTLHVDEDGALSRKPVTLWLDSTGENPSFVYKVPPYVTEALGCMAEISSDTAENARREYDRLLRRYSEHAKNAKAEPVILLNVDYHSSDGQHASRSWHRHDKPGEKGAEISITYRLAFRVKGVLYEAKNVYEQIEQEVWPGEKRMVDDTSKPPTLKPGPIESYATAADAIPYTPELHAKLDQIIGAIDGACQVLDGIAKAKDRAAAVLALGRTLLAASPTKQSDTPTTESA